jgi:hypothetical protein
VPNGCGASCGTCGATETCNASFQCVPDTGQLTLQAISPDSGFNDVETDVSITGGGFKSGATVRLGGTDLSAVQILSASLISARVPSGMAEGMYMLIVLNSDGGTASLPDAFEVRRRPCDPICNNRECGPDGCGGTCGTCAGGETCDGNGQCQGCTPACTGKECGDNGCGGTCGSCAAGESCDAGGQCVGGCVPQCTGKQCGPDGCNGVCGTCTADQICDVNQTCVSKSSDGCGCNQLPESEPFGLILALVLLGVLRRRWA